MSPFALTVSLAAALSAMPAMAQNDGFATKPIRIEIADDDADFAVALLSLSNGTVPFLGDLILADAQALLLWKQDGTFVSADLTLRGALWWQGVTYDLQKGLEIHPIQKLNADLGPAGGNGTKPEAQVPAGQLPPLELQLAPARHDPSRAQLLARFVAETSDYGLRLVRVAESADAGIADVYIYRKVPGEGEGLMELVEEHRLTVDLPAVEMVRVFLAEGTTSRPGASTAWTLLATLW